VFETAAGEYGHPDPELGHADIVVEEAATLNRTVGQGNYHYVLQMRG
jgi:hypothetical protein